MAALQTLRLNDNRLTQLTSAMVGLGAVASVDEDLGTQLGALATLDLNSNKLTAIPDGALQDVGELHRLDLSHNRIAAVTMAMIAAGPQTKLTYLELHHNPVAKVDTAALAMLGGSAGHMNALGNWPAGDQHGFPPTCKPQAQVPHTSPRYLTHVKARGRRSCSAAHAITHLTPGPPQGRL
jgi:hypothetical protein